MCARKDKDMLTVFLTTVYIAVQRLVIALMVTLVLDVNFLFTMRIKVTLLQLSQITHLVMN